MKALKCLPILLSLIIVSCESATEPKDCAGVAGGTAVLSGCDNACNSTAVEDMCGTCDNDASNDCASGTYTLSTVTMHTSGDCSDDNGTLGICFPPVEETPVSESDCDETGTAFCMDANTGDSIEGIEAAADCTGDDKIWIIVGWNLWVNLFQTMTLTFSDDGTYTDSGDESGTWTLDGTTLTMTDSQGEVSTATVSGNTLTAEVIDAFISDVDCVVMVFTK